MTVLSTGDPKHARPLPWCAAGPGAFEASPVASSVPASVRSHATAMKWMHVSRSAALQ